MPNLPEFFPPLRGDELLYGPSDPAFRQELYRTGGTAYSVPGIHRDTVDVPDATPFVRAQHMPSLLRRHGQHQDGTASPLDTQDGFFLDLLLSRVQDARLRPQGRYPHAPSWVDAP
jgi:hypothetical protein